MLPSQELSTTLNGIGERSQASDPERSQSSDPKSWREFADGGVIEHDAEHDRKAVAIQQEAQRIYATRPKASKIELSASPYSSGSGTLLDGCTTSSDSRSADFPTHVGAVYGDHGGARQVWRGTFRSSDPMPEPIPEPIQNGASDDDLLGFD